MSNNKIADDFRSGEIITENYDGWSDEIKEEFKKNEFNGHVGSELVFENYRLRIWNMTLEPGEKMPVHRHVLDYFWTAVTSGRFLQRNHDGTTYESDYNAGVTHYYEVKEGEFALHNLENVGDTTMIFTTVEFKESPNKPLDL